MSSSKFFRVIPVQIGAVSYTHLDVYKRQALLAGDTLLTAAFETLSGSPGTAVQNTAAVCALSRAAGANGMVWGQELDLAFERCV